MDITIRRAVRADCPRLLELIRELAGFEKAGPDAVSVAPEHFVESGFGENPVWWAFVAEASAPVAAPASPAPAASASAVGAPVIVAFALYYIRYSTWKGQRLYLEDLIVTQDMRGRGVGKLLFDRLIEETREKKFSGMVWQVLDWNEPAIQFYKKQGAVLEPEWVNCILAL